MNLESLLERVPAHLRFAGFEEMHANTQSLKGRRAFEVRLLGRDRFGLPIEMISVGDGPKSILLVGAPHPNEPIGCVGIEWLIQQLGDDERLRRESGLRWHFVKAIEPYALRQNEGWFQRRDLAAYFEHFYRPALAQQAEYGFPSRDGEGSAVVENAAYRRALELARPDLLATLHNCESVGAFYFLSRRHPSLADELSRQPARHGLPLNTGGERVMGSVDVPIAPGVFLPGPAEAAPGESLSVSEYLHANGHATLVLVPEVPLFRDTGTPPSQETAQGMRDDVKLALALRARVDDLAGDATPLEACYIDAVRENTEFAVQLLADLEAVSERATAAERDAQVRSCRTFALRPIAMARRLFELRLESGGASPVARGARDLAQHHLRSVLETPSMRDAFRPAALGPCVAAQLDAVFAAVRLAL